MASSIACVFVVLAAAWLTGRQRGTERDVASGRQTQIELLITPINNLSQPQDIELGLPAACFRLRAMKPSKALVIKARRVGYRKTQTPAAHYSAIMAYFLLRLSVVFCDSPLKDFNRLLHFRLHCG